MKKGFTLVELSIVLVIIGLIVGGVMMGRDLVQTAQLRSVLSQYEEYVAATNAFHLKYGGLPGDLDRASIYFGQVGGACSSTQTNNNSTLTCSGDGDFAIESVATSPSGSSTREIFRFWQQLAAAKLIGGQFHGAQGATTLDAVIDGNVPSTTFDNIGFGIASTTMGSVFDDNFLPGNTNFFMVGADLIFVNGVAFSTEDMFYMDSKLDDGAPGLGIFQSHQHNTCISDLADKNAAEYLLTRTNPTDCIALIVLPLK